MNQDQISTLSAYSFIVGALALAVMCVYGVSV
jgi:hypothetical protein